MKDKLKSLGVGLVCIAPTTIATAAIILLTNAFWGELDAVEKVIYIILTLGLLVLTGKHIIFIGDELMEGWTSYAENMVIRNELRRLDKYRNVELWNDFHRTVLAEKEDNGDEETT